MATTKTPERPYAADSWQRHGREQRLRWLRLSYAERLAWLWQAKLFALKAQGAARRDRPTGKV